MVQTGLKTVVMWYSWLLINLQALSIFSDTPLTYGKHRVLSFLVFFTWCSSPSKRCIVEHKQSVKIFDKSNGVAVHAKTHDNHINREYAKVVTVKKSFWRRRAQEAIRVWTQDSSINLYCGLSLSRLWDSVLPTWLSFSSFQFFRFTSYLSEFSVTYISVCFRALYTLFQLCSADNGLRTETCCICL